VKLDLQALSRFYQRLSQRERWLLSLALGAILAVLLYVLVWEPLVQARETVTSRIRSQERQLVATQRMRTAYMELLSQWEAAQVVFVKPDTKIELLPHIEATVSEVVSRDRIVSMSPESKVIAEIYREESVDLKLINLSLDQVVDLMHRIEKGVHPLRITKLNLKKRPRDPHSFDVIATVSMLKVMGG